jgi:hypothetical protein
MSKNKKGKKQSKGKLKRLRISLWKLNPLCHYCFKQTQLPTDFPDLLSLQKKGITPDNMATVEHIYTRYEPERFEEGGEDKCVLACYKCNKDREREVSSKLSKEELQEKSNRFPISHYVTAEQKEEIIKNVFGEIELKTESDIDKFVSNYFCGESDLAERLNLKKTHVAVIIRLHRNLLKKELNENGEQ